MKRTLRQLTFGLMVLATIFAAPAQTVRGAGPRQVQHRGRLDTNLRALVDGAAPERQRVIIRVRPGNRPELERSLTATGDQIVAEHDASDTLTAFVHGADLGELADKDFVLSVSTDAIVRPHGLLDGLLGLVGGVVKTLGTV